MGNSNIVEDGLKGSLDVVHEAWYDTCNWITVTPGSDTAIISGRTFIKEKINSHILNIGKGFEAIAVVTWEIHLTLVSVKEGGLKIELNLPPGKTNMFEYEKKQDNWPWRIYTKQAEELLSRLEGSISKIPFESIKKNLNEALGGAARFVLPGAKTFFYKNAMFNNHGDVLLQLEYNGVE